MPKLAIYIPKKDMREIDKWRKKINFSRIFMQALHKEIRELSHEAKSPQDKVAAAARFYKEKLIEKSGDLLEFGNQLGRDKVMECKLSPEVILQIVEIREHDSLDADDTAVIEKALKSDKKFD